MHFQKDHNCFGNASLFWGQCVLRGSPAPTPTGATGIPVAAYRTVTEGLCEPSNELRIAFWFQMLERKKLRIRPKGRKLRILRVFVDGLEQKKLRRIGARQSSQTFNYGTRSRPHTLPARQTCLCFVFFLVLARGNGANETLLFRAELRDRSLNDAVLAASRAFCSFNG